MKFAHVTIMVKNLEDSINFYENIVGLPIVDRFSAGPDQEIVFLGKGETLIELIYNKNIQDLSIGEDISIGFEIDNLNETMITIKEKDIEFHSGPFQPNEFTKFFFIQDPNGMKVQFIEHSS